MTVITPVYNGEKFVNRCYDMLKSQTFKEWEWVVVDDGSTDRTANVVRNIDDPRIQLISYPVNAGRGFARTAAINASRGEWIVIWDIDDMNFPDRLEKINEAQTGGYDFFCSYAIVVDNNVNVKGVRGFYRATKAFPKYFVHPTLACRTDLARDIGYSPIYHTGEDFTIMLVLAANYNGCFFEDALAIYQEDREVTLEKAISTNWSQLQQVRTLYKRGILHVGYLSYIIMVCKWYSKLLILNLMRITPSIYLKTVNMRTYGEIALDWKLSQERKLFLDTLTKVI